MLIRACFINSLTKRPHFAKLFGSLQGMRVDEKKLPRVSCINHQQGPYGDSQEKKGEFGIYGWEQGRWLGRMCEGTCLVIYVPPVAAKTHSATQTAGRFCLADSCCLHLWALPDSQSHLPPSAKALTDSQCFRTYDEFIGRHSSWKDTSQVQHSPFCTRWPAPLKMCALIH